MDSLKTKLEPADLIVLYVSSHGSAPDKFGRLNIIPYDLNASPALKLPGGWDPAQRHTEAQYLAVAKARYEVQRSAIPADEITDFMKDSPAGRVVGILDVCYSGAALDGLFSPLGDAGYQVRERSNVQGISSRQVTSALGLSGEKDLIAEGQSLPTQSSVRHAGIRDFSYPELGVPSTAPGTDSSAQTGKVLLTATSGGEQSLFDGSGETGIKNSFFTYFLLQGLEATGGQTRKAFEYSRPRTWSIARDLAHKQQTPQYQTNPNNNRLNLPLF
jgi:Caspase domain